MELKKGLIKVTSNEISRKKLTSLFYLEDSILGKDFFIVPLYLAKSLNYEFDFVYPSWEKNQNMPFEYRGANLIPIVSDSEFEFSLLKERQSIRYIIKNAKKIDFLFLVWLNKRNLLLTLIYKSLNRNGYCFIKGDLNENQLKVFEKSNTIFKNIWYRIKERLNNNIDTVSCETEHSFSLIKEGVLGKVISEKVCLLSNSFDEEMRIDFKLNVNKFEDKENVILVVGRIGTVQKNHEVILNALDNIDLSDWKVVFIGPVEEDFKLKVDGYLNDNPKNINKIIFTGSVYSKKELWEYYNKSKVFLLTSVFEGFPNVFPEALRFGCYIVTTNVSSANDITDNGRVGKIIDVNSVLQLKYFLEKELLIDKIDLRTNYYEAIKLSEKRFLWNNNISAIVAKIENNI